jgi:hypothetical protein
VVPLYSKLVLLVGQNVTGLEVGLFEDVSLKAMFLLHREECENITPSVH